MEYIWKDRKRFLGMPLSFTRYAINEDRLFNITGFLTTKYEEVLLYRIQDISLSISLWQMIFGVGTIKIVSSDKTMPTIVLKNIKRPKQVKELLHKQVEEMKIRRHVRLGEIITGETDDLDSDYLDDEM